MMKINASELPVMKAHCKTCPFRKDPKTGLEQDIEMCNAVTTRTLFKAHQICHGTEGENRKPRNRCKGSFDNNMIIYEAMRVDHLITK